jgi:hypothetical protein
VENYGWKAIIISGVIAECPVTESVKQVGAIPEDREQGQ